MRPYQAAQPRGDSQPRGDGVLVVLGLRSRHDEARLDVRPHDIDRVVRAQPWAPGSTCGAGPADSPGRVRCGSPTGPRRRSRNAPDRSRGSPDAPPPGWSPRRRPRRRRNDRPGRERSAGRGRRKLFLRLAGVDAGRPARGALLVGPSAIHIVPPAVPDQRGSPPRRRVGTPIARPSRRAPARRTRRPWSADASPHRPRRRRSHRPELKRSPPPAAAPQSRSSSRPPAPPADTRRRTLVQQPAHSARM